MATQNASPSIAPASTQDIVADSCANCTAFYQQPKLGNKLGQCRRNPPTPIIAAFLIEQMPDGKTLMVPARGIDGAWPVTGADLHCQQYERKHGASGIVPLPVPVVGEVVPLKGGES